MMNLAEYRKKPKLLADYLPWAALIAPGVVLNKDGSFQRTARFRGPDLDSATEAELVGTTVMRLHHADFNRLGVAEGDIVALEGTSNASLPVQVDDAVPRGCAELAWGTLNREGEDVVRSLVAGADVVTVVRVATR